MHGLGDCLHQRAVLRQLLPYHDITLETSWPSIFHDLPVRCIRRPVNLRTQKKNADRESDKFYPIHRVTGTKTLRISYVGKQVLAVPSRTILEVMCQTTGTAYDVADYSLPIPDEWTAKLTGLPQWETLWRAKIASGKPLLVYRPLVARPEWRGSIARNADPPDYTKLFQTIRDTFFVVSVADLEPGKEWLVGPRLRADATFHEGELHFEALAALFSLADIVYTSSGFAAILGPAVGTATISVVGGYETIGCHDSGRKLAPYLAIGPRGGQCMCWTSSCTKTCDKRLNMDQADEQVRGFLSEKRIQIWDNVRSFGEMFDPEFGPGPLPPARVLGQHAQLMQQMTKGIK